MSRSSSGNELWAEMTEAQKLETVRNGEATLKELAAGLLDGSEELRQACGESLAHTDASLARLYIPGEVFSAAEPIPEPNDDPPKPLQASNKTAHETKSRHRKGGLPDGFVPRLQRYGKTVLLENNIYRLPDSREFIPCLPRGTLDHLRHLYALLSLEEYANAEKGSVYVHPDGRIFDYGIDTVDPAREPFDTGYNIYDLERTGRYAPVQVRKRKESATTG
jgi:hypothetical protein